MLPQLVQLRFWNGEERAGGRPALEPGSIELGVVRREQACHSCERRFVGRDTSTRSRGQTCLLWQANDELMNDSKSFGGSQGICCKVARLSRVCSSAVKHTLSVLDALIARVTHL